MTDFIRLADDTEIQIEAGASLGNIVHVAPTEADGLAVAAAFTVANVAHVEFFSKDENQVAQDPSGIYDNLALDHVYYDTQNALVLVSLHEKSSIELRLDAIEEEQEIQNEAIDFLAMEA